MKTKNIYQLAREGSGLTQERASEYLNISIHSIQAYEQGTRNVPDDIVIAMAELYEFKLLCYQHLRSKATANDLPEVKQRCLTHSSIMLLQSLEEVKPCVGKLLKMASDGKISEDEKEEFNALLEKLDKLQEACLTLKYCKEG